VSGGAGRDAAATRLDRQRQAVETPADLLHSRPRLFVERDAPSGGQLEEEGRRVVDRQGREGDDVLARKAQRDTARRENVEIGDTAEERGDVGRRECQMLEIVEHEQRAVPSSASASRSMSSRPGDSRTPSTRAIAAGHERGVGDGGKADEVHGTLDRGRCGRLERQPALAGPARPG